MPPINKYKFTDKQKAFFNSKYVILSRASRNAYYVKIAVLGVFIYFLVPIYLVMKLLEYRQNKNSPFILAVIALILGYVFWMRRRHESGQTSSMQKDGLLVLDCQTLRPIKGFKFFIYQCKDTFASLKLLISEMNQKNREDAQPVGTPSPFSKAIQLDSSSLNLSTEKGDDDSLVMDEAAVTPRPRFVENDNFCTSPILVDMDEAFGVVVVSLAPVEEIPVPKLKPSRQT